jgi:hypothetical protein
MNKNHAPGVRSDEGEGFAPSLSFVTRIPYAQMNFRQRVGAHEGFFSIGVCRIALGRAEEDITHG